MMTLGKVHAPLLSCDYRSLNGKQRCTNTFGGDRLGEPTAELRRRAEAASWGIGSCVYWAKLHPGRTYDLCPRCAALPDSMPAEPALRVLSIDRLNPG
jgi:hypothetical protein